MSKDEECEQETIVPVESSRKEETAEVANEVKKEEEKVSVIKQKFYLTLYLHKEK